MKCHALKIVTAKIVKKFVLKVFLYVFDFKFYRHVNAKTAGFVIKMDNADANQDLQEFNVSKFVLLEDGVR